MMLLRTRASDCRMLAYGPEPVSRLKGHLMFPRGFVVVETAFNQEVQVWCRKESLVPQFSGWLFHAMTPCRLVFA